VNTVKPLVDEEFRMEQKVIDATVRELLKAYLRSKFPHASDEQLAGKHRWGAVQAESSCDP
jgi:hypothetical protein